MYDNLLIQASYEIQDKLLSPKLIYQSNSSFGGKHNCSTPDPGFTGGELYKLLGPTLSTLYYTGLTLYQSSAFS